MPTKPTFGSILLELNKYSKFAFLQVSWTKEIKDAKTGDYEVHLYDDEGYSAVKRVLEKGEDVSSVKPLVTIVVNYPVSFELC